MIFHCTEVHGSSDAALITQKEVKPQEPVHSSWEYVVEFRAWRVVGGYMSKQGHSALTLLNKK